MPRKKSRGELWVQHVLEELHAPAWTPEYEFDGKRGWRMDVAWPHLKVYLEFDGFGHERFHSFQKDVEKHNAAAMQGWRMVRITTLMLNETNWDGYTADRVMRDLVAHLKELDRGAQDDSEIA
jgi:hypothetical protein